MRRLIALMSLVANVSGVAGVAFVIENKAGAGGIVGAEFAKNQPADGYTIFLGNTGTMGLYPAVYAKLPYDAVKDFAPAVTDLIGGQVQLLIDVAAVSLQHVKAGKLKALAVTSAKRNAAFPELPTFDEAGLPGFLAMGWQGILVPTGTSREVINKLAGAIQKVMADPGVREKFQTVGSEATPSGPEAFGAFIRAEIEKWTRIAKAANVKVEP